MPIYEYRCTLCGFQKEYLQKLSDAQLTDCPECGKASLSKMVTAAGFQLKGSGWYATDFKTSTKPKTDKAADGKSETKSESKSDDKSAVKSETKPATASDSKPAAESSTTKSESTKTTPASSSAGASST